MLLAQYRVTRIAAIGSDDNYGHAGIANLKLYGSRLSTPVHIVKELLDLNSSGVDTYVAFCVLDVSYPMLEQVRVLDMLHRPKAWIFGASGTAFVVGENTTIVSLVTGLGSGPVRRQFEADMLAFANLTTPTSLPYLAYDAAMTFVNGIKQMIRRGLDPWNHTALFETLIGLRFTGATGPVSFDQNGDRFLTMTISTWLPNLGGQPDIGNWSIAGGVFIDPRDTHAFLVPSEEIVLGEELSSNMQAKVCDFGLTIFAHKTAKPLGTTAEGDVGSLLWSSPEVLSGEQFTTKSDVYAFGIIVWETLARQVPYKDINPLAVVNRVVQEKLRPQISGPQFGNAKPLVRVMEQCWDQSPRCHTRPLQLVHY
eukprot:m51a1_g12167 putative protein kinase (367) ;mRNA; r:2466-4704